MAQGTTTACDQTKLQSAIGRMCWPWPWPDPDSFFNTMALLCQGSHRPLCVFGAARLLQTSRFLCLWDFLLYVFLTRRSIALLLSCRGLGSGGTLSPILRIAVKLVCTRAIDVYLSVCLPTCWSSKPETWCFGLRGFQNGVEQILCLRY